jgi:hypothetical protein
MPALVLGMLGAIALTALASMRDPIGVGYLLSTRVDAVADARLREDPAHLPVLYWLAALVAGAGVLVEFAELAPHLRWSAGVVVAVLALLTLWDLRRRRGALAVYIRLRRAEIGFEPKGDVIEVPALMFLVMNQSSPLLWLVAAALLAGIAVMLYPTYTWAAAVPLGILALGLVVLWVVNHRGPWERVARQIRRSSLLGGRRLTEHLERVLDLDPEVVALRAEADSMVARVIGSGD